MFRHAARVLLFGLFASLAAPTQASPGNVSQHLATALRDFDTGAVESGILYDRVLSLSHPEEFHGGIFSRAASPKEWRQLYYELHRASIAVPTWPSLSELTDREVARPARARIVSLDFDYDRLRADGVATGAIVIENGIIHPGVGDATESHRAVAAAILPAYMYRGGELTFRFAARDFVTNRGRIPVSMEADFGDDRGFIPIRFDADARIRYATVGEKTIRFHFRFEDGSEAYAGGIFDVRALGTPTPHDTLHVTAGLSYGGAYGTGDAYVYLADGHSAITKPVVVLEGFDLDNSMDWDELYALLNREGMLEQLRALGFDAVVLNFTQAVDFIQRNAFVAVELIEEVQAIVAPGTRIPLVGASMGGLVGRYALAYMETNDRPHSVSTFLSFDSPQTGAGIPLGIQYWLAFFADDSAEAAALLAALDAPAARQMLVYHHTDPPGNTGASDPLRTQLLADFVAVGDYPNEPRKVAIANGSGNQIGQGFAPGAQIVSWEYTSFLVDITGNVWAVPNTTSQTIFHGLINFIFLPEDEQFVTVNQTRPYDNCPGGWRSSMAEMDATQAPYGDIVALYPNHAFIPAVSALALDTNDLFYDIAGDGDLLAHTPFDAVYFPSTNQEHVEITAQNAAWFLAEVQQAVVDVPGAETPAASVRLVVAPNPLQGNGRIHFAAPTNGDARLSLVDASGRSLHVFAKPENVAGTGHIDWDPRRMGLARGVYFIRLEGDGLAAVRKCIVR